VVDKGKSKWQTAGNITFKKAKRNIKALRNRPSDRQEYLYMDTSERQGTKTPKTSKLMTLCVQGKV